MTGRVKTFLSVPEASAQARLRAKKSFACVLALVFVFGLFAGIPPAADVAFAARPCGHDGAEPGDHDPASCSVPGHYNCDGQTHEIVQCWLDYAAGGGIPEIPGGIPGVPGGIPGFPGGTTGGGSDDDPTGGGIPEIPGGSPFGDGDGAQEDIPPYDPPPEPPVPDGMEPPSKPPIEIEIPDGRSDLELRLDARDIRELAQQGTWRISCRESIDRTANELFDFEIIFSFDAVRHGGEGMFGEYFGVGMLSIPVGTSRLTAQYPMGAECEYEMTGPIENVFLELHDLSALGDDVLLGPLFPDIDDDDSLVSLVPEHLREKEMAYGSASAIWRCNVTKNYVIAYHPYGALTASMIDETGIKQLTLWLYALDRGTVRVYVGGLPFSRTLVFYGTISQVINYR